jgi:hypothetical protein
MSKNSINGRIFKTSLQQILEVIEANRVQL